MSFIRHRSSRLMLPSLAIAALLPLAITAVPASAAAARAPGTAAFRSTGAAAPEAGTVKMRASTTSCGQPVFFGLHGMNEGPASNAKNSPEMLDMNKDLNNPAISTGVKFVPITYPDVGFADLKTMLNTARNLTVLQTGEKALTDAIKNFTGNCPARKDKIAVVGYSLGAWIVNDWITHHAGGLDNDVKAVVLFGDPCWVDGKDRGLVRRSPVAGGFGCMPGPPLGDYPFYAAANFQAQSWAANLDPVAGAGWGSKTFAQQLLAAINCKRKDGCTHLGYAGSSAESDAAQFIVNTLGGVG